MTLCEDDTAGEEGLVARAELSANVNFKVQKERGSEGKGWDGFPSIAV
jgi:hypothetical protein